ncbi:MAG: hypothetical protein ACRD0A_17835 [Acidimicrobiales bacterium]
MVAEISRQRSAIRLDLAGMSDSEVGEKLTLVLGRPPSADVVATVARRTAGNPLFVQEIGRLLATRPERPAGDGRVPDAVRTAISERLDHLSPECRALLATGSVMGIDIDPILVAAVAGLGVHAVLSHLDEALAEGVVTQSRFAPGYRFAHDLVRECVDLDNPSSERARIHLRAAEHLGGLGPDRRLSEIAYHRLEALPLGDAPAAFRAATGAAALAMSQLAYEDAARLYGRALDAAAIAGVAPGARCGLLVDRARAQHLAHDVSAAMASCEQAAALAQQGGDAEALGRAAVVLVDVSDVDWLVKVQAWARRALAGLGDGDSPGRSSSPSTPSPGSTTATPRPWPWPAPRRSPWPNGSTTLPPCLPLSGPASWHDRHPMAMPSGWPWPTACSS